MRADEQLLGGVGGDRQETRPGSAVISRRCAGCCAIRLPDSAGRRRVGHMLGWAHAAQRPGTVLPVGMPWPMPAPWMLGCNRPMGDDSLMPGRPSGLMDRQAECGVLDQLINAVQAGGSRVLVVRGEPGVGKSALLDYLAGRAAGCWVLRAAGVESEMKLAVSYRSPRTSRRPDCPRTRWARCTAEAASPWR